MIARAGATANSAIFIPLDTRLAVLLFWLPQTWDHLAVSEKGCWAKYSSLNGSLPKATLIGLAIFLARKLAGLSSNHAQAITLGSHQA